MAGRAEYTIKLGNEAITFEGPDGLTDAQIEDLADKQLKTAKPGQSFKHSHFTGVVAAPKAPEHSAVGSFFRGLPHDAMMNFDDEITAAGNAAIPGMAALDRASGLNDKSQTSMYDSNNGGFWDTFHKNMEALKATRQQDEVQHPMASSAGRVAGVLSLLPLAGKAAAARLPQAVRTVMESHPIFSAMGIGGATGAASGAGAGEGNRGQSAALGGMTGTALGGVLGSAVEAAPAISSYVRLLFNKGQVASQRALGALATSLKRDLKIDVSDPKFGDVVRKAIQDFTGKPVSLADLGTATRARTGVALRTPSDQQVPAIDRITQRTEGQRNRLATDVRATVAPRTDVHAMDEELVAQRAEQAEELRRRALFEQKPDEALAVPNAEGGVARTVSREVVPTTEQNKVPVAGNLVSRPVLDSQLQQLARLPLAQDALGAAVKNAEAERALLAVQGKDISHLPDITTKGADLDMRSFDYLKRFLDQQVNRLYKGDTETFTKAQLNNVKALRDVIRGRLREVNPEYGEYLDAYSGSSEMIDSLRSGRDFTKLDPEEIISQQAGRSEAGRELYKAGAARDILDRIRSTTDRGAPADRILNSDESRNQVKALLDPEPFARLNKSVQQERVLNLLPQELKGSQGDARRLAQEEADMGSSLHVPWNPASKYSIAGTILRGAIGKLSTARNAQVSEALLPRATATDPKVIEATIQELIQQGNVAAARKLRQALIARRLAAGMGTTIGAPVSLPTGEE
jgi:hypothetical protein